MGVAQNGWFIVEHRIKMDDDWGYPYFRTPPYRWHDGNRMLEMFLLQFGWSRDVLDGLTFHHAPPCAGPEVCSAPWVSELGDC